MFDVLIDVTDAQLWRDPHGTAYATITYRGRMSRHKVDTQEFRNFIRYAWGSENPIVTKRGKRLGSVSNTAVNEVILALEAAALDGPVWCPEVRIL
jgi:hypothetical protein